MARNNWKPLIFMAMWKHFSRKINLFTLFPQAVTTNTETQSLLYALWQRYSDPSQQQTERKKFWSEDSELLHRLGVSLEETIGFLFFEKRSFAQFESWIEARNRNSQSQNPPPQHDAAPVLSETDLLFWQQNGYLVLPHAVADEDCDAAAQAVWQYMRADRHNPSTWYNNHEGKRGMMLQFFDHPALDRNRRSARIRKAYEQLYGHTDILLTIDKVSFNAPETDTHLFTGSPLHWDVSLVPPVPYNLQGLLYLHDVSANQGAFQCVPGFHLQIDQWLRSLPPDTDPRRIIADVAQPVTIPGKKGDMIIWHNALPHCATPNRSSEPRLVQYITWYERNRKMNGEWK